MKKAAYLISLILFACSNEQPPIDNTSEQFINEMESMALPEMDTVELEMAMEEEPCVLNLFDQTIRAYVSDVPGEQTNVRGDVGGDVIYQLSNTTGHELTLTGECNGWFRVESIWSPDNDEETYEETIGYVHGSVLAVSTRNYGGEELKLYTDASESSKVSKTFKEETAFKLITASPEGSWLKVKGNGMEGWIQVKWLCGSVVTLCS